MLWEALRELLQENFNTDYALEWDNPGLLAGDRKEEIKRVYVAVDATDEIIEKAVNAKADLLLTHHPLIFGAIKNVTYESIVGRRIIKMIKNDMLYYAMHTNFDVLGMADYSANILGLNKDLQVLEETAEIDGEAFGIGKVGTVDGKTFAVKELAKLVKEKFDLETVTVFGDLEKEVTRIAISPGSGKGMAAEALAKGAQVLITGDITHHDGIDAVAEGLVIIDAGHYGIEKIFVPYMVDFLKKNTDLDIVGEELKNPFKVI